MTIYFPVGICLKFGKPLLRIQGPEKVNIVWYLQIYTLPTQKLKFIYLELTQTLNIKSFFGKGGIQQLRGPNFDQF